MRATLALSLVGLWAAPALASEAVAATTQTRPPQLRDTEVVEKLGEPLPLSLTFVDAQGRAVRLGDFFGKSHRPVVLSLVYYGCPALCGVVLNGMVKGLRESGMQLGEDYTLLTVSIDPKESPELAAKKQAGHLQALGFPGRAKDWQFLTGDEASIRALAEAVGFGFRYDAPTGQYAHSAVLMVLTPEGKVSRYVYGVTFPPRDLRLAMVEAAGGKVGTTLDRVLLTCFQYDPSTRRYEWVLKGAIQGGGLLVFVALAGLLGVLWRRELRPRREG